MSRVSGAEGITPGGVEINFHYVTWCDTWGNFARQEKP